MFRSQRIPKKRSRRELRLIPINKWNLIVKVTVDGIDYWEIRLYPQKMTKVAFSLQGKLKCVRDNQYITYHRFPHYQWIIRLTNFDIILLKKSTIYPNTFFYDFSISNFSCNWENIFFWKFNSLWNVLVYES